MDRILITGASGNVGKYEAQYALKNSQQISVAGTQIDGPIQRYKNTAKIVQFDFTDSTTFDAALEDVDRVFYYASTHLENPEDIKPFIDKLKSILKRLDSHTVIFVLVSLCKK